MGLTSNTGLLASVSQKPILVRQKSYVELRCEVSPAPFMLRPYAGIYNPFSNACSVLCNHPADSEAKEFVRKAKDSWLLEGKTHYFGEDLSKTQDQNGPDKHKIRTPHDIVTEDMFRRYTETDSRPHTPAPTLASGKSRGSRRCLTPDQPRPRTAIVLDLRRSHSQETLYYHGCTSDLTIGHATSVSVTNDRSTLPSLNGLNPPGGAPARLLRGCERLPPLAGPLVLAPRAPLARDTHSQRSEKKNQLKALKLGKAIKNKGEPQPASQRSKRGKDTNDGSETVRVDLDASGDGGELRRRGKRYRRARAAGSDRLASAGLAAHSQQDPETQIAGIGTDSQNPSSRGSVAPVDDDVIILPVVKTGGARKTDSFLDDEILKFLHREVDEEAIETEFDTKRRYVLEEALRTRPERARGAELQALLREVKAPAVSLGHWLHIPRVFSRQSAQFSLPIDSNALESLSPMQYAARFVAVQRSKQLLYLTALRKFKPAGYRMPIWDIGEGLKLMMGGILTAAQVERFRSVMEWDAYEEEDNIPDEIKLTLPDTGYRKLQRHGDSEEPDGHSLKYRTWCGVCAVCERMFGRFPPRETDPPDGMELSDFTMLETKLATLTVHPGLTEVLNVIRVR